MERRNRWGPVGLALAFVAGLLTALSPCVLPLLPQWWIDLLAGA
jgi:cytochrome c biogenesis protein CcdA